MIRTRDDQVVIGRGRVRRVYRHGDPRNINLALQCRTCGVWFDTGLHESQRHLPGLRASATRHRACDACQAVEHRLVEYLKADRAKQFVLEALAEAYRQEAEHGTNNHVVDRGHLRDAVRTGNAMGRHSRLAESLRSMLTARFAHREARCAQHVQRREA